MTDFLRVLCGEIPLEPLVEALIAGHLVIWWDGQIYLTESGAEYVEGASGASS